MGHFSLVRIVRSSRGVIRPVLTVAAMLALGLVVPLYAQGNNGPAPLVNLVTVAENFIIYILCPAGAIWLLASAALKASQGHHGAGGGAATSVVAAVCLLSITVIASYLRSL